MFAYKSRSLYSWFNDGGSGDDGDVDDNDDGICVVAVVVMMMTKTILFAIFKSHSFDDTKLIICEH